MSRSIDFGQIRSYEGDKRTGFEEFVCQLARREHASEMGVFRRIEGAGGDGGVEAYFERPSGSKIGYQAKYFLATKDIDWSQIDASVKTAIRLHPTLERYVVAIPCDLTGRSGRLERGKTGWEHWETHKAKWANWCDAAGIEVEFVPWTKSDIVDRLVSSADRRGLGLFWFEREIFDDQWFRKRFDVAKDDLGERFQPADHIVTGLSQVFDGLARTNDYKEFLADWFRTTPRPIDLGRHLQVVDPEFADANTSALDETLLRLRSHGDTLASVGVEALPLSQWRHDIKAAADSVSTLIGRLYEKHGVDLEERLRRSLRKARQALHDIEYHLDTTPIYLAQKEHEVRVRADLTKSIVVVGEAGSGKSHLFADAVDRALAGSRPALLLLGQHFHGKGLIPAPLRTDRCGPVEGGEGTNAASVVEKGVPGRAAGVEDVVVARPEAMREEALAQVQPHSFDRVQLGRIGGQEDRRQVGRDIEFAGDVPAGAVHEDHGMRVRCHGLAELVEHRLHGGGADRGEDERDAGIALRTDGAEQIDRLMAQVAHAARAHAALEPASADAAGLADPGLVEKPDLEPLGLGVVAGDLGDQRREFFLKRAWALRSASG